MAKIKHIAYTTTDPDKVAAFFMETLGMEEVGRGSVTPIETLSRIIYSTVRILQECSGPVNIWRITQDGIEEVVEREHEGREMRQTTDQSGV